jgi:hypothetical protein
MKAPKRSSVTPLSGKGARGMVIRGMVIRHRPIASIRHLCPPERLFWLMIYMNVMQAFQQYIDPAMLIIQKGS